MSIYEYDEQRQRRFDRKEGYEDGLKRGEELGLKRGEERLSSLLNLLMENGKEDSIQRAITDKEYREELYTTYNI